MPRDLASRLSAFCWPSARQKSLIEKPNASSLLSSGQSSLFSRNSPTTNLVRLRISPRPPFWNWLKEATCPAPKTSSWWEIQGWGNLDQLTTPIDLIMSPPEETVTVVDPRHPLFGRTLPCVGIANS